MRRGKRNRKGEPDQRICLIRFPDPVKSSSSMRQKAHREFGTREHFVVLRPGPTIDLAGRLSARTKENAASLIKSLPRWIGHIKQ